MRFSLCSKQSPALLPPPIDKMKPPTPWGESLSPSLPSIGNREVAVGSRTKIINIQQSPLKHHAIFFIDIETTNFEPSPEGRIIEIACVEMKDGKLTGREFYQLLNPEHSIPDFIVELIEIDDEMVAGRPTFYDIYPDLLDFIGDGKLVGHRADFDREFIDYEISLIGLDSPHLVDPESWIDTLACFKERHPEKRYTLDAVCEMYGVDITNHKTSLANTLQEARKLAAFWQKFCNAQ